MSSEDRELFQRFQRKQEELAKTLDLEILPRRKDRILHFWWGDVPLVYDRSRFGVLESELTNRPHGGWQVMLARGFQDAEENVLDWVLWREAFLGFLLPHLRHIPEAADLGLFAGLQYGNFKQSDCEVLSELWKQVSPPQHYQHYIYDGPFGFPLFNQVISGRFLSRVIPWLNTLRPTASGITLTTETYTAALERWMLETHIPLTESELLILTALSDLTTPLHQSHLADQLNMSISGLSQHLTNLAQRHHLRLLRSIDLPLIGLLPLEVFFNVANRKMAQKISAIISSFQYVYFIQPFRETILHCRLLIPYERLDIVSEWLENLSMSEGTGIVQPIANSSLFFNWNFDAYIPDSGWSFDFTLILNLIKSSISNNLENQVSPNQGFHYSYDSIGLKEFPIRLQLEDFAYIRRTFDSILLTERIASQPSQELRDLGIPETMHMRYRRRIRKLERLKISKNNGITLFHIGLDTVLKIYINESRMVSEQVLGVLSLLPYLNGIVLENGHAYVFAYVTNSNAVDTLSTLQKTFAKNEIEASIEARPAWQSFTGFETPVSPKNYDFAKGEWKWDECTLPKIRKNT